MINFRNTMRRLLIAGAAVTITVGALAGCGTAMNQPFGFTIFHKPQGEPMCTVLYTQNTKQGKTLCEGCDGTAVASTQESTNANEQFSNAD